MVAGKSTLVSATATSPLKLLAPIPRGSSVWAFLGSLGGGHVAGDRTRLDVRVGRGARCYVGTQAATKIYRNPRSLPSTHTMRAEIGPAGLLVHLPDPVQPFLGSEYTQRQSFHLEPTAGLVLVDWLGAGRAACGERWAFTRLQSRNEIWVDGERTFLDSLLLDRDDGLDASARFGRYNALALLALVGSPLLDASAALLAEVARTPVTRRASCVASASPIRGGALLRIAGERVEDVGHELRRHLSFLGGWLGDDPWSRKW